MAADHQSETYHAIEMTIGRLVFRWSHDRWTHTLELPSADGYFPFARSVEADGGGGDSSDPVSPTYQDIQVVDDQPQGIHIGLLVGGFGRHHYSAQFRAWHGRYESGPRSVINVDVADRCRDGASPLLTATYRICAPPTDRVWWPG